tara:strand:+ start:275 stop:463 length:189 start_codon:yes stop_codon:yes gene_type:complete
MIIDPAKRQRCLNYEGEFAKPEDSNVQDQGPHPWDPPKPRPKPNPRSGGGNRRRGGGGFGEY